MKHKKISIGTKLEVKKRFDFDHSLEIKIRQHPALTISEQLAKNIFVTSPLAPLQSRLLSGGEGKRNKK
jgi:DtxR family Mn-dependent transcriptional regulator